MSKPPYIVGVDVAKIVAMAFVVGVHVAGDGFACGAGGVQTFGKGLTMGFFATCINVFAIASGYVGVNARFRVSRLVELWLQVVFTCVVCSVGLVLLTAERLSAEQWIRNLMPISGAKYWYMTAYFMLAFTMPFLNAGIRVMEKRESGLVIGAALAIVCGQAFVGIKGGLGVEAGYSYAWLVILYLVGAYWRLHGQERRGRPWLWLAPMLPLAVVSGVVPSMLPDAIANRVYWCGYVSPFTVALSVCIFGWALSLKIEGERTRKLIKSVASCTLGVYLFHYTPLLYGHLILPYVKATSVSGAADWAVHVSATVVVVFAVCALLDAVRQLIFRTVKRYVL